MPTPTKIKAKNRSNLLSPCKLRGPCDLTALDAWFRAELDAVVSKPEQEVVNLIHKHLDEFVKWPCKPLLLWAGCDRSIKYHKYPQMIQLLALNADLGLDRRENGPAVAAYRLAGGTRPARLGSTNGWSIHHIYSGKFPYPGKDQTIHATKSVTHFTQSAGLVAAHPLADQACDEYPFFAWHLRAMAFHKFHYDPDEVFSSQPHDEYGFVGGRCYVVPLTAAPSGGTG